MRRPPTSSRPRPPSCSAPGPVRLSSAWNARGASCGEGAQAPPGAALRAAQLAPAPHAEGWRALQHPHAPSGAHSRMPAAQPSARPRARAAAPWRASPRLRPAGLGAAQPWDLPLGARRAGLAVAARSGCGVFRGEPPQTAPVPAAASAAGTAAGSVAAPAAAAAAAAAAVLAATAAAATPVSRKGVPVASATERMAAAGPALCTWAWRLPAPAAACP
mmetsp:Transcript_61253/g.192859  ORF Transcript_61253/g.192859 Transcript_61253/m.192859 type:complete len:218 (+) Transcript_61253:1363-2016(+)